MNDVPETGSEVLAVSVDTASMDAAVSDHFGRASVFILCDMMSMSTRMVKIERQKKADLDRGVDTAIKLNSEGVTDLILSRVGPRAYSVLKQLGIRPYDGSGLTVSEAIHRFYRSTLREITAPNAESHAGQ